MTTLETNALAEEVLKTGVVCRLAMSVHDQPYLVPLCYGYEPGRLFFHSGPGGQKLEMLAQNPQVCFEVESDVAVLPAPTPCRFSMRFRSVVGYGRAVRLEGEAEKRHGLDMVIRQYGAEPGNYGRDALDRVEVYAIEIQSVMYRQAHVED